MHIAAERERRAKTDDGWRLCARFLAWFRCFGGELFGGSLKESGRLDPVGEISKPFRHRPEPAPFLTGKKLSMRRKKNKANRSVNLQMLPIVNPNAAGIDVGAKEHLVAVPCDPDPQPVRTFQAFTPDLHELAAWLKLKRCGIETVALEAGSCRMRRRLSGLWMAINRPPRDEESQYGEAPPKPRATRQPRSEGASCNS